MFRWNAIPSQFQFEPWPFTLFQTKFNKFGNCEKKLLLKTTQKLLRYLNLFSKLCFHNKSLNCWKHIIVYFYQDILTFSFTSSIFRFNMKCKMSIWYKGKHYKETNTRWISISERKFFRRLVTIRQRIYNWHFDFVDDKITKHTRHKKKKIPLTAHQSLSKLFYFLIFKKIPH